jgi:alcohol dehydrogenase YqhD (iron-dependent ADH family)
MLTVDFSEFKITVKYGDKSELVTIDPDNLVESIREIVKEKFAIDEGDAYQFKKAGTVIDGTKTIRDAGIKAGDTITIDYGEISIKVKTPSGVVITLTVDPDNKLKTIKDKIKA